MVIYKAPDLSKPSFISYWNIHDDMFGHIYMVPSKKKSVPIWWEVIWKRFERRLISSLPLLRSDWKLGVQCTYLPAEWISAHKPTELSRIKQKLELDSPSLWWTSTYIYIYTGKLIFIFPQPTEDLLDWCGTQAQTNMLKELSPAAGNSTHSAIWL